MKPRQATTSISNSHSFGLPVPAVCADVIFGSHHLLKVFKNSRGFNDAYIIIFSQAVILGNYISIETNYTPLYLSFLKPASWL